MPIIAVLVLVAVAGVFSGCSQQAVATGPAAGDLTLKGIPPAALSALDDRENGGDADAISALPILNGAVGVVMTANGYSSSALENWSLLSPPTYSSAGRTYTWQHLGTTWIWNGSWADASVAGNPTTTLAMRATVSSGSFSVQMDINGAPLYNGNTYGRGTSGSVTLYPSTPSSVSSYSYAWVPEQPGSAYTTQFTVIANNAQPSASGNVTVVIEADDLGETPPLLTLPLQ